jgi:ferredoxin-NADP reductase
VCYVVSGPEVGWNGPRGYIDAELLHRELPANYRSLQYFICGPGAMQDALEDALGGLGVAAGRVHTERFNFV